MNRPRKITVTFFLNKNVKPEIIHPKFSVTGKYPLYIQVTYNRRNTQFRSTYRCCYSDMKEVFSTKEDMEHRKYEKTLIRKVVEYEVRHLGKKFDLKGLNNRYLDYSENIINPIDNYFRNLIYEAIIKTDTEFVEILDPWKLQEVSFLLYYKAASNLIKELNKKLPLDFSLEMNMGAEFIKWAAAKDEVIRLIDWIDHSAIKAYESYLKKKKYNESKIQIMISLINRIIKLNAGLVVY